MNYAKRSSRSVWHRNRCLIRQGRDSAIVELQAEAAALRATIERQRDALAAIVAVVNANGRVPEYPLLARARSTAEAALAWSAPFAE